MTDLVVDDADARDRIGVRPADVLQKVNALFLEVLRFVAKCFPAVDPTAPRLAQRTEKGPQVALSRGDVALSPVELGSDPVELAALR